MYKYYVFYYYSFYDKAPAMDDTEISSEHPLNAIELKERIIDQISERTLWKKDIFKVYLANIEEFISDE